MITVRTLSLKRFQNACGFTATFRKWGNRRIADMGKVETEADKQRLRLSKQLIQAKEYDAIVKFMSGIQSWIYTQTVPSFFKEGFQLASIAAVEPVEARMKKACQVELPALVEAFLKVYPAKIEEAKIALKDQFVARDYPSVEEVRPLFDISWNWLSFTLPDGLPEELKQQETDKLKRQFEDAAQQITLALRVAFQELIAHAAERLTEAPGEKRKVIRDSMLGNVQAFLDTFEQRDLMNDVELAQLVAQARLVILPLTPQKLRDVAMTREGTRQKFEAIKTQIDGMITTARGRKIDLASEQADEAA